MSTTTQIVRSRGGSNSATPMTGMLSIYFSFDATQASAALTDGDGGSLTLPSGFVPMWVMHDGGATGGTNPTIDIGTATDDDAFIAEGDGDAGAPTLVGAGGVTAGASLGTKLTADTVVYGGKGASAATGGTVTGYIFGVMHDTGASLL